VIGGDACTVAQQSYTAVHRQQLLNGIGLTLCRNPRVDTAKPRGRHLPVVTVVTSHD
jgi:hypothetical protein